VRHSPQKYYPNYWKESCWTIFIGYEVGNVRDQGWKSWFESDVLGWPNSSIDFMFL